MATSGSVSTSKYEGRYYTVSWTATQDVNTNKSTIKWTLSAVGGSSSWYAERTLKVVIGGDTVYSKTNRVERHTGTITSGTKTIAHDSNGDASFSISVQGAVYYSTVNCTGSQTFTLNNIPRASAFGTVTGNTIGSDMTVNITRNSTSFTHQLWYKVGNSSWVDLGTGIGTSKTFTIDMSMCSQLPNATSGTLQLCIRTYNGTAQVGSDVYKNITVYVPLSAKPTIALSIDDGNGYFPAYNAFVQGKSVLSVAITSTGVYGSTIKSYKTTFDGRTYTTDSFTTPAISGSGLLELSIAVTDTRGRTATISKFINVLEYAPPSITSLKAERCDASGNASASGTYLKIIFSSLVSPLESKNDASYVLQCKKSTEESYTNVLLTDYAGNLAVENGIHIIPVDSGSYDLILRVADRFVVSQRQTIGHSVKRLWSWLKNNKGLAFGKIAEKEDTVEFDFDAQFNKNVYIGETDVGAKLEKVAHSRVLGEYIDQTLYGATGHITNNSTDIYLYIPMIWASDAETVTVSSIKCTIRHVGGGYLGGAQDVDLTSYIDSATLVKEQGILYIKLRNSSGWAVTNNTPITGICKLSYAVS